jgi:O-acetyl-ADP-ribose deacetylase (regulator of RNase III)
MIEFTTGDILTAKAEAVVNTVNCVGVMGRGIALQFKNTFPENFKAYKAACKKQEIVPGRMFVFETGELAFPRYIINFPTKRHWKGKSRIEDIESGLEDFVRVINELKIESVALPPLGSGLGGLVWEEVRARIENALSKNNARILVFEPSGAPENDVMRYGKQIPDMTAGRAALIGLINRYQNGLPDPFITLFEVHKLMYFLQETGENLRLNYTKAPYGPYAENLRHVLNAIEGYFIYGYDGKGDRSNKQLKLVPGALHDAEKYLQDYPVTRNHYNRIADLVNGYESPFGLELLSTVHWVIKKENAQTYDDVCRVIYAWDERKKQFSTEQIKIAMTVLTDKGWISPLTETF